ncbi:hypothetical protein O6P43_034959 [Quillaja saponaria]|uniref:Uncharacterized protein n=1 Tax=Quillaja saponaria TaxID=32244 RepID=A0AAD7KMF3_QUISA|nr:hypothetical protein O6P43_034959 [Quillaja saponaria]
MSWALAAPWQHLDSMPRCVKGVSRVCQGMSRHVKSVSRCVKASRGGVEGGVEGVSRGCRGCVVGVSWVCRGGVVGVSRGCPWVCRGGVVGVSWGCRGGCRGGVAGVSRVCRGCVTSVSRGCRGGVEGVSRVCHECVEGVSRHVKGVSRHVEGVSRVCQGGCQGCVEVVSRVCPGGCQGCVKGVSRVPACSWGHTSDTSRHPPPTPLTCPCHGMSWACPVHKRCVKAGGAVAAGDHRRPPPTTAGGGGFRRVGKFWLENFGVAVPRIDSYANAGRVEPCGLSTRLARRGRRRRRLTPRGDARVVAAAVPNRFSCQGGVRGALRAVDAASPTRAKTQTMHPARRHTRRRGYCPEQIRMPTRRACRALRESVDAPSPTRAKAQTTYPAGRDASVVAAAVPNGFMCRCGCCPGETYMPSGSVFAKKPRMLRITLPKEFLLKADAATIP